MPERDRRSGTPGEIRRKPAGRFVCTSPAVEIPHAAAVQEPSLHFHEARAGGSALGSRCPLRDQLPGNKESNATRQSFCLTSLLLHHHHHPFRSATCFPGSLPILPTAPLTLSSADNINNPPTHTHGNLSPATATIPNRKKPGSPLRLPTAPPQGQRASQRETHPGRGARGRASGIWPR